MAVCACASGPRQNERVSVVKAQYGPTLPQILGRRSRGLQVAVAGLLALAIVAGALLALRARADETALIVRGPTTFNLVYASNLQRVSEPRTLLALRRERNGLFLDSYVVRALDLPPYRGAVGGTLPVYAAGYLDGLRKRYGSRYVGNATFTVPLGHKFTFVNRDQIQYENRYSRANAVVIRLRALIRREVAVGKTTIEPFVSSELFYDSRLKTVSRYREQFGVSHKFSPQFSSDVYYVRQDETGNHTRPGTLNGIGTAFRINGR